MKVIINAYETAFKPKKGVKGAGPVDAFSNRDK
jgi:hypothetical protein